MRLLHRLGITALVSAIEDAGLIIWLAMLHTSPALSVALAAAVTLFTFLSVEHLISQRDSAGKLTKRSILQVLGFTALEVVNWAVWLALTAISPLAAVSYFATSFYAEHQITYNVKKGRPFLKFSGGSIGEDVLAETASELTGSVLWLALPPPFNIIALVTGSSVEHFIASGQ